MNLLKAIFGLRLVSYPQNILNPSGPDVLFLHQGLRGGENSPPLKKRCFSKENMFYHHEVNFCINSALFWCIALFSSSILANFSNFIEKSAKFGIFQKIESYSSYIHQKKAKMIQKLIPRQINLIYSRK